MAEAKRKYEEDEQDDYYVSDEDTVYHGDNNNLGIPEKRQKCNSCIPQSEPDFERLVTDKEKKGSRYYESISVSNNDYERVVLKKGEHCDLVATGSGMTCWHLYHANDGSKKFIVYSLSGEYKWQNACGEKGFKLID